MRLLLSAVLDTLELDRSSSVHYRSRHLVDSLDRIAQIPRRLDGIENLLAPLALPYAPKAALQMIASGTMASRGIARKKGKAPGINGPFCTH